MERFLKTAPFKILSKKKAYMEVTYHPSERNIFAKEIVSSFESYKTLITCDYSEKYQVFYKRIEHFYNRFLSVPVKRGGLKEFDVGFLGEEKINKEYYSIVFSIYPTLEESLWVRVAYLRPQQITEIKDVKDLLDADTLFLAKRKVFLDDVDEYSGIIEGLVGTLYTYKVNEVFWWVNCYSLIEVVASCFTDRLLAISTGVNSDRSSPTR